MGATVKLKVGQGKKSKAQKAALVAKKPPPKTQTKKHAKQAKPILEKGGKAKEKKEANGLSTTPQEAVELKFFPASPSSTSKKITASGNEK